MDGIQLCRQLRADARTRDIPLIAVTGYDDRHYPDRAIKAGANRVLLKPLYGDVLLDEVRHLLIAADGPSVTPVR
jgi:CheY-like chemotaxis protein